MKKLIKLAELGLIPDFLIRFGIKLLLKERLQLINSQDREQLERALETSPLAVDCDEANNQHYMVPTEFFQKALGKHLKYSCCYFTDKNKSLSQAEEQSLIMVCDRAELQNKQNILELGCGWGSFSLFAASRFPDSNFTAVSNSSSQKLFIVQEAEKRGIKNLKVITEDINKLELQQQFDRIVSIEMFEHVRNYKILFEKISNWLNPNGKLFVHVFCHKNKPYLFENTSDTDWMSENFFTGGVMPSVSLFDKYKGKLQLENNWLINGSHYQQTAECWLDNLYKNKEDILKLFQKTYGIKNAKIWFNRWRMFFLSCSELFGFGSGEEWLVSHYLFKK